MGKVPTILCNASVADNAFQAHAALIAVEAEHPELAGNPFWTMLRQDAYERFYRAFDRATG